MPSELQRDEGRSRRFCVHRRDAAREHGAIREQQHAIGDRRVGLVLEAQLGERVRGFTVVGSNGLGLERSPTPLQRVAPGADEAEEFATHRYNLSQLMIADPDKIDELALYLQKTNHARARMRSRRFSRSGALVEALPRITARLDGIWGERDATAYPHLDERARILRGFQANARFAVVPGAGHWVAYEAPDRFNALIAEFAAGFAAFFSPLSPSAVDASPSVSSLPPAGAALTSVSTTNGGSM